MPSFESASSSLVPSQRSWWKDVIGSTILSQALCLWLCSCLSAFHSGLCRLRHFKGHFEGLKLVSGTDSDKTELCRHRHEAGEQR